MPDLEKTDMRIQVICDKIRAETLDPAKEQAQEIIENARREAERILHIAHSDAEKILKEARKALECEKQIFQSSLEQAAKQSIELLKQKIEQSLFNPHLSRWVQEQLGDEKAYATLVEALVKAIEKEGIKTELAIKIPQAFRADTINAHLSQHILDQLTNKSVELSDISGGIQVKIKAKNMVLDISSKALEEIIASFIHKDFRKVFFGQQ